MNYKRTPKDRYLRAYQLTKMGADIHTAAKHIGVTSYCLRAAFKRMGKI